MKRILSCALAFCGTLLFGGVYADEIAGPTQVASQAKCKNTKSQKCTPAKPSVKQKMKKKKKLKPLAPVKPSIRKDYTPLVASPRMLAIIAVYKSCMYEGEENRLDRALGRALLPRGDKQLGSSPEKLGNEICLADALGLKRYEKSEDIREARRAGELVEIPTLPALVIADDIVADERSYARPWVRDYLVELARDMEKEFGGTDAKGREKRFTPLRIGSLVRSYENQRTQWNSPARCEFLSKERDERGRLVDVWKEEKALCSAHTTGASADISLSGLFLGRKERAWLRKRLLLDRKLGKIIMIEERFPPHFHFLVIPPEFVPQQEE
ncbi:MAG: hypothetical protein Q7S52_01005 [bacterium]|nr:hypothetical protein [bacterium]